MARRENRRQRAADVGSICRADCPAGIANGSVTLSFEATEFFQRFEQCVGIMGFSQNLRRTGMATNLRLRHCTVTSLSWRPERTITGMFAVAGVVRNLVSKYWASPFGMK
jgi:hypothetical protein